MKQFIQTQEQFIVTRDGEDVTDDYQPSPLEQAIDQVKAAIALQVRMFVYDTIHRTHYRRIRNRLAREKRNQEFEQRIGLVATSR